MRLILHIIIYIIVAYITLIEEATSQTIATKYTYTCTFNSMFDRGMSVKRYHAILMTEGEQSWFTMKADADNAQDSHLMMTDMEADSIFTVYKDLESNSLLFEVNDLNQHALMFADTLYPMHWEMIDEQKTIANIPCLKAQTVFKGRKYIVWYATSIPTMNGPWKLGGLPGLILEAQDQEDNWHINYDSQENISSIDFNRFQKSMKGNLPSYTGYAAEVKKIFKRATQHLASQQTGNCLTCQTKSTLKLTTWESID